MPVCRDVPANIDRNWSNLNEMYVALGVRHSGEGGPALAPPSTYSESQGLPYMVGLQGLPKRSIDISLFNDADARACFFRWAGYDETTINARITALRNEHPDDQAAADAAVQTYLGTLPPLQQQIYRTVGMINIFRQDYRLENGANVGGANRGNPDAAEPADPNVISDYEIQQYAAEALEGGDENPQYAATGGRILTGIHSLMGLMHYVTTPQAAPQAPDAGVTPAVDAGPVSLAPDAAVCGPDAESPADAAPIPQEDAGVRPASRHRRERHSGSSLWSFFSGLANVYHDHPLISAAVTLALGGLGGYLLRGRPGGAPVSQTSANPAPQAATPATQERRAPQQQTAVATEASRTTAAPADGTFDGELDEALFSLPAEAAAQAAPPPLPSRLQFGPDAEPSVGVDAAVVRAQIVLRCRNFMSLAARNALLNNQPLPEGAQLVDSHFASQVERMTNAVLSAYQRWNTNNPGAIREQWLRERAAGQPIVRDGVPDRMLTEVLGPILREMGRTHAGAEAVTAVIVMSEARDHFANRENLEHAFREILRHGR